MVVAHLGVWPQWPWSGPLAAGGGSHSLGLCLGGGKVHHYDPLSLERGLAPRQLVWLGRDGHLLARELVALPRAQG
jgi:hypothetical protein